MYLRQFSTGTVQELVKHRTCGIIPLQSKLKSTLDNSVKELIEILNTQAQCLNVIFSDWTLIDDTTFQDCFYLLDNTNPYYIIFLIQNPNNIDTETIQNSINEIGIPVIIK